VLVHVVDRVRAGNGRGLSAIALAVAQHRAGRGVRLLVSGVRSPELLPASPAAEPLLGDLTAESFNDPAAIDRVATALGTLTSPVDVLICHNGVDLAAACRLRRRVVAAVHGRPEDYVGYLPPADLTRVRQRTSHWMVWGSSSALELRALFGQGVSISVTGQAIPPSAERSPTLQRLAGSPALLTVARLHWIKNHSLILRALAELANDLPDVHWHFVGDSQVPAYEQELRTLAVTQRVSGRVSWHGYRDDAADLMRAADAVVLASHSEGLPRAIQEGMLLRVPTVLPAALAVDLAHAGLPVVYDRQEPGELAAAVRAALAVGSDHLAAAAEEVRRRWSWTRLVAQWDRVTAPSAQTGDNFIRWRDSQANPPSRRR
jgi:glycosyltransferase involved in cell wall biosynthesis